MMHVAVKWFDSFSEAVEFAESALADREHARAEIYRNAFHPEYWCVRVEYRESVVGDPPCGSRELSVLS